MTEFARAFRLKLYPTASAEQKFTRNAGACRWLWNFLLERNIERYRADKKFIFRYDMQRMLPDLKLEYPWLSEAPATALQRVCANLDAALRRSFKDKRYGFPRFKARRNRPSFYLTNQQFAIVGAKINLPKVGLVRFRCGELPEGKILSGNITLQGNAWYCTINCQQSARPVEVEPSAASTVGVDMGLSALMVTSDEVRIVVPKAERRKMRQIRLLRKSMSRKRRGSANREKARRLLSVAEARLANIRRDCRHKATRSLVDRASVVVLEDLNVRGMSRSLRLGKSVGIAGMGEVRRQISYKAQWAGKTVVVADRFFPSTQICAECGQVKTEASRLKLSDRSYNCDCGHHMDRDLNAAMNLRRYGLNVLGLLSDKTWGQAMPSSPENSPGKACGDSSAGPLTLVNGRYGSMNQEPLTADSPKNAEEAEATSDAGNDSLKRALERSNV